MTVRQILSDDPAAKAQANFYNFGGGPFLYRRLPALAGNTDEYRASIQAIQLWLYINTSSAICQPIFKYLFTFVKRAEIFYRFIAFYG